MREVKDWKAMWGKLKEEYSRNQSENEDVTLGCIWKDIDAIEKEIA